MDEMAKIQKLARQALKTFRVNGPPVKENLDVLKAMMGTITAQDVNLVPPGKNRRPSYPGAAPVTHVDIIECPYFSMAVFIVSKGRKLPLHDHPGMYGFCKIHKNRNGAILNSNESQPEKFLYQGQHMFESDNGVCMVTPTQGNLHTIRAVNGPAAFLDILGPPYSTEKDRDCLYYKECRTEDEESDVRYLQEVPCPLEFFCDSQEYRGPAVRYEDLTRASEDE